MATKKTSTEPQYNHIDLVHKYGIDTTARELYLENHDAGYVDDHMAVEFIKNMRTLQATAGEITVHILSYGGCEFAGFAIMDAIEASPCHITTVSWAGACSMASLIPQVADRRIIMPTCQVLVHWGDYGYYGHAKGFVSEADMCKRWNEMIIDKYVDVAVAAPMFKDHQRSQVREYFESRMDKKVEWWMSPEEAVEVGLFDQVGMRNE